MLLFLMLLSGATLASAVALPVRVSIGIALLVGAVSVLDVHRRGERLLWANLGVSWMPIPLVSAATALVCEALLAATL